MNRIPKKDFDPKTALDIDAVKKTVADVCKAYAEIIAAYLFGSAVKAQLKETSDIDIAILLDHSSHMDFFIPGFMVELEKKLERRVDIVVLNRAGEVLKYEVRRTGQIIFDRNPMIRKRFEVISRKYFEDFRYLHRRYSQNVLYGEHRGQLFTD